MADVPYVLPPEEIDRLRAEREARAEASAYLASQGVAGYTPANAAASMPVSSPAIPPGAFDPPAPPAPPAPPPAGKPSVLGKVARGVAVDTAGMLLGGPVGGMIVRGATSENPMAKAPPPKREEIPPGAFDPPAPPPAAEEDDLVLSNGGGARGRGGMVIPAGMYPDSMTTSKRVGKEVPLESKRAMNASTSLELGAAEKERDAAQSYYQNTRDLYAAHMKATEDARVAHAAVQANRDAEVNRRLAEIEALNKQAQGRPEDLWTDRSALASMIGAIATGIGLASGSVGGAVAGATSGNLMQTFINQDINAKLKSQKSAGDRAARQTDLLGHYIQKFGQEDKAIDATRLAYYDNVLQQMDMYKAEHAAQVSQAKYDAVRADILARRADTVNKLHAQETDDVSQQYREQWHNMQVVGGTGGSDGFAEAHKPGHTVVLPPSDATGGKSVRVAVGEQETAQRLQKEAAYVGRLTDINNRAVILRNQVREAASKPSMESAHTAANARRELLRLEQEKSKLLSSKDAQGVLKEAEYLRTMDVEVGLTNVDILADTNKQLRRENEHMTKGLQQSIKAASGSVVKQGFVRDKHGALKKVQLETGKFYEPEILAPEVDDEVK